LAAESGEIALSVDSGRENRKESARGMSSLFQSLPPGLNSDPESASILAIMEQRYRQVRATVEREGELTDAAIGGSGQDSGQLDPIGECLARFRLKLNENPDGLDAVALRARNKKRALAFLDGRLWEIASKNEARVERKHKEEEAHRAADMLPSVPVLDKIIRYETKLERQLYRALAQLERLQRMRRGEAVPPPLTMEVRHGIS
jgi:hypothetical protein